MRDLIITDRMSKNKEEDTRYFDSLNAVTPQNKEEYVKKIESVKPEKLRVFKVICYEILYSAKAFTCFHIILWFFLCIKPRLHEQMLCDNFLCDNFYSLV